MAQYLFVCEYHDEDNQARFIIVTAESYVDANRIAAKEGKLKNIAFQTKCIGATSFHPSNSLIYSQELTNLNPDDKSTVQDVCEEP